MPVHEVVMEVGIHTCLVGVGGVFMTIQFNIGQALNARV